MGAASAGAADGRGRQAAGGEQGSPVGAAVGFGGRCGAESRGGGSRQSRPDLHEDGVSKGWPRRLSVSAPQIRMGFWRLTPADSSFGVTRSQTPAIFPAGHRPQTRSLGSKASRTLSPMKLKPMTSNMIATPGAMLSHMFVSMYRRPVFSIDPQAGVGG